MDIRGENTDNLNNEQYRFNHVVEKNYSQYIKKNSSILEIGCYKGYTLKELKKYTNNENIFGIELSNSAVNFAKKYTGLNQIYNEDAFDVIIMKAVLEHIEKQRIEQLINLIYASLKNDGVALISVPNMAWIMSNHERYTSSRIYGGKST